ncbi:MAG TPA: hypothetical protein VF702_13725 [Allosphingosinicella sp.]|jgi:hypothetical protein
MGSIFPLLTSGIALTMLGVIVLMFAIVQLGANYNHAGYKPGTPGYARARDGRRYGYMSLAAALLLFAAAWFTPLGGIVLI